jgi:hypothetical protein
LGDSAEERRRVRRRNGTNNRNVSETLRSRKPVVCIDEQPVTLRANVAGRESIRETATHSKRVDYEYVRKGTASVFMFVESLTGFCYINARKRRTKIDWALEVAALAKQFSYARKIILVYDNLNTHTYGVFYEAFPPRRLHDFATLLKYDTRLFMEVG